MRKLSILVSIIIMLTTHLCYSQSSGHFTINKNLRNDKNELLLLPSDGNKLNLQFNLNSYDLVKIESQNGFILEANDMSENLKKGAPHLPLYAKSVLTKNNKDYIVNITNSEFFEIQNIKILPSKGEILRNKDPKTIPYFYGEEYTTDSFYPSDICKMQQAYILRNLRGQTVHINPFLYNAKTNTLRIYTKINLELTPTSIKSEINNISNTKSKNSDLRFEKIYDSHFLNYSTSSLKYTPLNDNIGNMLIISYGAFIPEIQAFATWKRQKGIPVEIVDVSSIGNASSIKAYVKDYYNNNGLTYLLLVGDNAQVPCSSTSAGDSDTDYGYINGSDHYIDIFVGRFSAETINQVKTQVERSIYYEKNLNTQDSWLGNGVGIASNEGSNPSDAEHMNTIQTKLESYNYTVSRCYQNGGSAQQLSNSINNGIGLINYVGHGSNTGFASMPFNINNVNSLTNINKLPFIFDVACVNGNFKSITCFAEAWLRATYNDKPTGAIAICASTINQSWVPPMIAQNEMNDILVESYQNNIKRSYSGIFFNGVFKMIDVHAAGGEKMADTWTMFGDPSIQIRTKTPEAIAASHNNEIASTTTSFTVSNIGNSAFVCLSKQGEILASKKSNNGNVNLSFVKQTLGSVLTITVTDFNKIPYIREIVVGGSTDKLECNFTANKTNINVGEAILFTDLSTGNPTAWTWTFEGGSPSASNLQNPNVVYQTEGAYFVRLNVANSTGEQENTVEAMITVNKAPVSEYCTVVPKDCSKYEYISLVDFANIKNNSVCDNYTNYSDVEADVIQGSIYKLNVSVGRYDSNDAVSAWIDWDKNGVFDNTTEKYILTFNNNIASADINIPDNVDRYKMRIKLTYNNTPTPCGEESYGEVEDYMLNVNAQEYCIPSSASFNKYEYIGQVSFSNINNSSSYSQYTDYNNISASVVKTNVYPISVTIKKHDNYDSVSAWFDWNNNGDFSDSNEEFLLQYTNDGIYNKDITIPSDAFQGKIKMRVRVSYNSTPTACGQDKFGETEDYTIYINNNREQSNRNINTEYSLDIYPNPVFEKCNISIRGNKSSKLNVIITDTQGKQVYNKNINTPEVDLSNLKTGIYIIQVKDNEGNTYTDKILVK